jgi:hypothetical protein
MPFVLSSGGLGFLRLYFAFLFDVFKKTWVSSHLLVKSPTEVLFFDECLWVRQYAAVLPCQNLSDCDPILCFYVLRLSHDDQV